MELLDKYQIDDLVKEIYIKLTIAYAINYKMDFLLEFITGYAEEISSRGQSKDGSDLKELLSHDDNQLQEKSHCEDWGGSLLNKLWQILRGGL